MLAFSAGGVAAALSLATVSAAAFAPATALFSDVSNGFPGVLGVLEEPNPAKAPEPMPKALEAFVGDVKLPGVTWPKRLERPWEASPPFLFENDALLDGESVCRLEDPLVPPVVDNERLPVLITRGYKVS